MPFTFSMPKLSPTMQEGTIAKWHKKENEFVEAGDLLLEVITDKATVEHHALDHGYIRKLLKHEGEKAVINEPLAIFTEEQSESIDGYVPANITSAQEAAQETPKKTPPAPRPIRAVTPPPPKPVAVAIPADSTRILASPLAKKKAALQGIDLSTIAGSGPHGRIVSRDLEQTDQPRAAIIRRLPDTQAPFTPMRQAIADRLQYSKSTIPHFYIQQNIDAGKLVELREELKKAEKNFTINDFFIKAVALALKKHPSVNCGFDPETQQSVRYGNIDISVAVTIDGGLITPIVANADQIPLQAISHTVKALAQKAKAGKLQPHEFQGGSFTISNLGMFGTTQFQAIINPPQGAILAIGAIQEIPVIKNGQVCCGKVVSCTLSCDHRVIDGAEAAQFLQTFKAFIENPVATLVQ